MSRRLVLDASAALHAVLGASGAEKALDALGEAAIVFAPELCCVEVANALWKYVRSGELDAGAAVGSLEQAMALVDMLVPSCELAKEALVTAAQAGHPAYDCTYAVLARREGAHVLTADRCFAAVLGRLQVPTLLVDHPEAQEPDAGRTRTSKPRRRS